MTASRTVRHRHLHYSQCPRSHAHVHFWPKVPAFCIYCITTIASPQKHRNPLVAALRPLTKRLVDVTRRTTSSRSDSRGRRAAARRRGGRGRGGGAGGRPAGGGGN